MADIKGKRNQLFFFFAQISSFHQITKPNFNKRVWSYYIILGGSLATIYILIKLAGTLQKLLF